LLHAVWAAGAMADWRRTDWRSWLPLVLLVAKLIYEQWSGASALLAGMPVVVNAHLYGAIGGALAAATLLLLKARQHQSL
jgi:membrane associated rhomboid family serine protease